MEYNIQEQTQKIKAKALELGFDGVGVSKAEEIEGFQNALQNWLDLGYHAQMEYMERNIEKRSNPAVLVPGAKSVISLLISYYPEKLIPETQPQIAKYAYGTDYHFVIKDKMQELWNFIQEQFPDLDGRMFVDSAPISDKLLAVKAGLGWLGKNSCLINKEIGSFVFISELIVTIPLEYDEPYRSNFCGSCTKCIDKCPTQAIVHPGVIDSNKCISFQTIENKLDTIPNSLRGTFNKRLFGCDICQDVCPWNKLPLTTKVKEFNASPEVLQLDLEQWQNMEREEFNVLFKNSPLKRAKFSGIKRNLDFLARKE